MTKSNKRDTCRPLFKKLGILPLPSQYTYILFIVFCCYEQEIIFTEFANS